MSVAARCRNAIDYTKPIDPLVEKVILEEIELDKLVTDAQLKGSTVINSEGGRQGVSSESIDRLISELLPWLRRNQNKVSDIQTKADRWEKIFGRGE